MLELRYKRCERACRNYLPQFELCTLNYTESFVGENEMHIYRLRSNPIEDKKLQKKYAVVNVTIKYYLILCFINVKADLHSTVRPGPISKH